MQEKQENHYEEHTERYVEYHGEYIKEYSGPADTSSGCLVFAMLSFFISVIYVLVTNFAADYL